MDWETLLLTNWHVKFVALVLIVAAYIDGKELRVPNWITYPLVFSGIIYNCCEYSWAGLGASLLGVLTGLLSLMLLYMIGGMGAGDVKLMAGLGAWLGWKITFYSSLATVIVGGVIAAAMIWRSGNAAKHYGNAVQIIHEVLTIKNPRKLSEIAAERKPTMYLLPYGIPICIGSIGYFLFAGLM